MGPRAQGPMGPSGCQPLRLPTPPVVNPSGCQPLRLPTPALAFRLDGRPTFGAEAEIVVSSRREATFSGKLAPRLDGSPTFGAEEKMVFRLDGRRLCLESRCFVSTAADFWNTRAAATRSDTQRPETVAAAAARTPPAHAPGARMTVVTNSLKLNCKFSYLVVLFTISLHAE